jgi:hypothetical protein
VRGSWVGATIDVSACFFDLTRRRGIEKVEVQAKAEVTNVRSSLNLDLDLSLIDILRAAFANEDAGGLFPRSLGETDTRTSHQHGPSHGLVPLRRRLDIALVVILTSPKLTHTNGVTRIMTWVSLRGPSLAV